MVSLGVDAAADDPESPLQVTADGYREAGRLLGATGLPAVAVQEGGYHLPTLGGLVGGVPRGPRSGTGLGMPGRASSSEDLDRRPVHHQVRVAVEKTLEVRRGSSASIIE